MIKTAKQFEPAEQFEKAMTDLDAAMFEIGAMFERMKWLSEKVRGEYAAARSSREDFELLTEAQAAERLQVKETHLGDLRRSLDLPHVAVGAKVRYTVDHLREITQILEVRKQRPSIRKAA